MYYLRSHLLCQFLRGTNAENESFILVDNNSTWIDLYLSVVHELAISFDLKSDLSFKNIKKMTRPSYSDSNVNFLFENEDVDPRFKTTQTLIRLMNTLDFQFTFGAMRAFQLERMSLNLSPVTEATEIKSLAVKYNTILRNIIELLKNDTDNTYEKLFRSTRFTKTNDVVSLDLIFQIIDVANTIQSADIEIKDWLTFLTTPALKFLSLKLSQQRSSSTNRWRME